jgi:hypothetical protein
MQIPKRILSIFRKPKKIYGGNIGVELWADRLAQQLHIEMASKVSAKLLLSGKYFGVLLHLDDDGYVKVKPIPLDKVDDCEEEGKSRVIIRHPPDISTKEYHNDRCDCDFCSYDFYAK